MKSASPAPRRSLLTLIAMGLCAMLAGLLAAVWIAKPAVVELKSGTLMREARPLPEFTLSDQQGQPYTREQLKGHWTLVFPGFTSCPDICPTTLALLKAAEGELGEVAQQLQVALLSVDPERDTPAKLAAYVHSFSPRFIGLTAPEAQLQPLARALGVAYVKVPGSAPGSYTMDHSAALILINPKGELAGFLTPPFELPTLVADLSQVLAGAR